MELPNLLPWETSTQILSPRETEQGDIVESSCPRTQICSSEAQKRPSPTGATEFGSVPRTQRRPRHAVESERHGQMVIEHLARGNLRTR